MPAAPHTVLIVDDSEDFRALLKKRLMTAGFEVSQAADGLQAIDHLMVETPDVVLLDINMPTMNGYDVLDWLNKNQFANVNVIMLSGESVRDNVVSCLTLGAKDFILKSAPKLELLSRIRRLCETKLLKEAHHEQISKQELLASPILIVDDDELSINLTARRLENQGHTVIKALHANQALEILQEQDIRLILLDFYMPEINGLDLLINIRNRYSPEQIGVIMLTANDNPDMVIDCIRRGADDYIMKPFHQAELLARVQTTLQHTLICQKEFTRRRNYEELAQLGRSIKERPQPS